MPELPEVETVVNDLRGKITGQRITDFSCRLAKALNRPLAQFRLGLVGRAVRRVWRRAKLILLDLDSGETLAVHLKMTGQLIWVSAGRRVTAGGGHPIADQPSLPSRFTQATFTFTDGAHLHFNDTRKFGYLRLYDTTQLAAALSGLGLEPLSGNFTKAAWRELLLAHPRTSIKRLLMDQAHLAGIGNIYADEICFAARLRPTRAVRRLTAVEALAVFRSIKRILRAAVASRGTTFRDYRDALGERGSYWPKRLVYGRAGEPCRRCGTLIRKLRHGGRGTHFCLKCQV